MKWNAQRKEQFLSELKEHGVVTRAAHSVGVSPKSVYDLKLRDPEFAKQLDEILQ